LRYEKDWYQLCGGHSRFILRLEKRTVSFNPIEQLSDFIPEELDGACKFNVSEISNVNRDELEEEVELEIEHETDVTESEPEMKVTDVSELEMKVIELETDVSELEMKVTDVIELKTDVKTDVPVDKKSTIKKTCCILIRYGARKGQPCNRVCKENEYCGIHRYETNEK
jgi:vacuolar-type H+-ATPase subunit I/STV1